MQNRTFVTGFGAFGAVKENPSSRLAAASERPFAVLEVAFAAVDEFLAALDPASFDRLLLLGVAAGRPTLTPEVFARNQIGKTPDVRGTARYGSIAPDGPLLLEGTLWTAEMLGGLVVSYGLRASYDAGSYLCNYVYYQALRRFPERKVGFLHVPSEETYPLARQTQVLQTVLELIEK